MDSSLPVRFARRGRFLLYAHDGMGLGHTRRSLAIAGALVAAAPGTSVLVASGSEGLNLFDVPPGVDVLKLPSIRKVANGEYAARRLELSAAETFDLRAAILSAARHAFAPCVVLADKHPEGAGGELGPALAAHRAGGGRAALGLRDILDDPAAVARDWAREGVTNQILRSHDLVLVYGQRGLHDLGRSYRLCPEIAERLRYCGYVGGARQGFARCERLNSTARPRVVATAGGGEDGAALISAFIDAADGAAWDAHAVAGPMAEEASRAALRARAEAAGVTFHDALSALGAQLHSFDALVTMGGYNTLVEAAIAAIPTVCIPRTHPRREQAIRADVFAVRGLIEHLCAADASPAALRGAVIRALAVDRESLRSRFAATLDLDGARQAALHLHALAAAGCAMSGGKE